MFPITCFNTLVGRTSNSQFLLGMLQIMLCTSYLLTGAKFCNIVQSLCCGSHLGQLSRSVLIFLILFRKQSVNLLARLFSSILVGKGFLLGLQ